MEIQSVIPARANGDDRLRASPESITTIVSMDSGPAHPSRLLPAWIMILPNSGQPRVNPSSVGTFSDVQLHIGE